MLRFGCIDEIGLLCALFLRKTKRILVIARSVFVEKMFVPRQCLLVVYRETGNWFIKV